MNKVIPIMKKNKDWDDPIRESAVKFVGKMQRTFFEHMDSCTKGLTTITDERIGAQCNIFIDALFSAAVAITGQTLNISVELEDKIVDTIREKFKQLRMNEISRK